MDFRCRICGSEESTLLTSTMTRACKGCGVMFMDEKLWSIGENEETFIDKIVEQMVREVLDEISN